MGVYFYLTDQEIDLETFQLSKVKVCFLGQFGAFLVVVAEGLS